MLKCYELPLLPRVKSRLLLSLSHLLSLITLIFSLTLISLNYNILTSVLKFVIYKKLLQNV